MCEEFIVHDVIQTLYEHKVTDKELQEDCIKRNKNSKFILELENMLKKYSVGYDCDFKELQKRIAENVKKDIYQIVD
ncbi:hypothetical protein [Lachnoclostridium sp. An138]|uniref:hypothetical protein n=1 Tax=Lachnoclostridium sp. An138 TaxID=1965560 RepID=UPI0011230FBB|nr:hypothetical protein [Lachnoclostridium sp. An138]